VTLLIGWWYTTLAWPRRTRAFPSAWVAIVVVGVVLVALDTPRYNATTDLRALRAALAEAPAPVFAFDLQELALSFNLDRPVVTSKHYGRFESHLRQGRAGYLVISDRALREQPGDPCRRRIAGRLVTRRPFTVLDLTECGQRALSPALRWSG
jgi:hypothetical protein